MARPKAARPRNNDPGAAAGDASDATSKDTQLVVGLAASLQLLDQFTRAGVTCLSPSDLTEQLEIRESVISAAANALVGEGLLEWTADQAALTLSGGAIAIGLTALSSMSVKRAAGPRMRKLASQAGFNVGLGILDQMRMTYVEACEGEALVGLRLFPGSRVPLLTSAMGRAYLAAQEPAQREALVADLRAHQDGDWPTLMHGLQHAQRDFEQLGFCISVGDWQREINGVAAPIRSPDGQLYAVNLGGPAYLLPEADLRGVFGPKLVKLAAAVERDCFTGGPGDAASNWSRQTSGRSEP